MIEYLKLEDLKIGMRVLEHQLDDIQEVCIYLADTAIVNDANGYPSLIEGTIVFFGSENEKEDFRKKMGGEADKLMLIFNTNLDGVIYG